MDLDIDIQGFGFWRPSNFPYNGGWPNDFIKVVVSVHGYGKPEVIIINNKTGAMVAADTT